MGFPSWVSWCFVWGFRLLVLCQSFPQCLQSYVPNLLTTFCISTMGLFRGMIWVWSDVPLVGVGVAPGGSLTFRTGHLRPGF